MDQARYLAELASDDVQPSKAELREQAKAACASFRGDVKRLPMIIALCCPSCKHRGSARIPPGRKMPRFRCKRCGTAI